MDRRSATPRQCPGDLQDRNVLQPNQRCGHVLGASGCGISLAYDEMVKSSESAGFDYFLVYFFSSLRTMDSLHAGHLQSSSHITSRCIDYSDLIISLPVFGYVHEHKDLLVHSSLRTMESLHAAHLQPSSHNT